MTLDILVSTIDEGILRVPSMLLPPIDGIGWVVSMQYTEELFLQMVPSILKERADVRLTFIQGRGLSINRNNAISKATADILLIADDDCRYSIDSLKSVIRFYKENPYADVVCFAAADYDGKPLKQYPSKLLPYNDALRLGYYPCSVEMTMRSTVSVRFDERFGLGSKLLCAGEEDVFIKDALMRKYDVLVCPKLIVRTNSNTTGCLFISNPRLQLTKGATFRYVYGIPRALWLTLKEAAHYLFHEGKNPFPILFNMLRGLWILR